MAFSSSMRKAKTLTQDEKEANVQRLLAEYRRALAFNQLDTANRLEAELHGAMMASGYNTPEKQLSVLRTAGRGMIC